MTGNPDRAESLFYEALDVEHDARGAFLDERCGDEVGLREEVERLLGADECLDVAEPPRAWARGLLARPWPRLEAFDVPPAARPSTEDVAATDD